jgi:hypothetical protein
MDDAWDTRWIAGGACAMAVALAVGACGATGGTACPAVAWGSALTVQFADDWPPVAGGVTVRCVPGCMDAVLPDGAGGSAAATEPVAGSSVTVTYTLSTPDSVVLTVLAPDGTALTEVDVDVDWRRVGGSEECGGPHEAAVVVPAP